MSIKEKILSGAQKAKKADLRPEDAKKADLSPKTALNDPTGPDLKLAASSPKEVVNPEQAKQAPAISPPPFISVFKSSERETALQPYKAARNWDGKFAKGSTGNPHGRPPSFVEYIRLMTDDGKELVDHALECLRGWVPVKWTDKATGLERCERLPADPRYQAEARAWLAERGYGKALQTIEVQRSDETPIDYSRLSLDETRTLLALMSKAQGETRVTGSQGQALPEGEIVE